MLSKFVYQTYSSIISRYGWFDWQSRIEPCVLTVYLYLSHLVTLLLKNTCQQAISFSFSDQISGVNTCISVSELPLCMPSISA